VRRPFFCCEDIAVTESFDWQRLDERDAQLPQTSHRLVPPENTFTAKQFSSLLGSSVSVAIFFALPVSLLAGISYPMALVFVGAGSLLTALVVGALWAADGGRAGTASRALGNLLYGLLCVCGVIGVITFVALWLFVHTAP
jgi:predicted PurR-regulated permease PerM